VATLLEWNAATNKTANNFNPDATYPHRSLWQNEALKSHFNTAGIYVQTHSINIDKQNFPPG